MTTYNPLKHDMECPYCGAGQNACHDDGFGYDEDVRHEHECSECGKNFVFTTMVSYHYEAFQADCLNGEPHEWTYLRRVVGRNHCTAFCRACGSRSTMHESEVLKLMEDPK